MSSKKSIQLQVIQATLVLALSFSLELSSPISAAASIVTGQSEYGSINDLRNFGGYAGLLPAKEEGNLMLLAGNSDSSKVKTRIKGCTGFSKTKSDTIRGQGRVQGRGVDRARRPGADDRGRLDHERRRGSDDPDGDDHGRDDRGKKDHGKEQEIRVDDQGFIGHKFDFLKPEKRRWDKRNSRDSEEPVSSMDGSDDPGSPDTKDH